MKQCFHKLSALCLIFTALIGCDQAEELLGAESRQEKRLQGKRVSVMTYQSQLTPDPALEQKGLRLIAPEKTDQFAFETALQQDGVENLKIDGFSRHNESVAGDGADWESPRVPQPVIGMNHLYAIDANGVVTAHKLEDIDQLAWRMETALSEDDESAPGGGLAYANGVVYVTTGYGSVIALVAKDGSLLWRRESETPIRSAPGVGEDKVFAITIDNQLLTYSARTGRLLWTHRGIKETAIYLSTVTPVVENGIVVAAYSSGEVFAIRADDGTPIWSDTLVLSQHTSAAAPLTGIDATPIIRDGIVYTLGNNGLMAANLLSNGRGVWDLEVSGYHTPWIAGEYVFILAEDATLMAVHKRDRGIKWITDLSDYLDDTNALPRFTDPMMLNNQIAIIHSDGELWLFDPVTGERKERYDMPDNISTTPAVAKGGLYLIDVDSNLYHYQ